MNRKPESEVEKDAGYRGVRPASSPLHAPWGAALPWNQRQLWPGIGGSFGLESAAALLWNQWQHSCGTGGSFAVELVAGFTWNRWQLWRGIRTLERWPISPRLGRRTHAIRIRPSGVGLRCGRYQGNAAGGGGHYYQGVA